jgi:serine/threonine protein kinase
MADYERLERLGAGNFGEVWLVYDRALAVRRAVKYIPKARIQDPTNLYKEPQTLMALSHENIVRVEDAGKMPDGTLYVAMEYLPRGSVEDVFRGRPVPLTRAFEILEDVCWALEFAHQKDYIHRDIKPANILIAQNNKAKLSDFGLATRVPRGGTASPYGYLTHVAPEVLRTGKTSKSSDIYALGVTAYRLINGDAFLPDVSDPSDIQDLILAGDYPDRDHYRPYIPNKVKRIINQCMAIPKSDRFGSACEFRRALETIRIHCDWRLRCRRRVITYITEIGSATHRVIITPDRSGHFDIATTKAVGSGSERRITKDCCSGLTLAQMKHRLRQILPRYVDRGK